MTQPVRPDDEPLPTGGGAPRVTVVPISQCAQEALEFRNANRAVTRDIAYLTWRYLSRPAGDAYVVWLESAGVRVAAATVAPHDFLLHGVTRRVGIVGDISVAAEARGRGLARPLMQAVVAQSVGSLHGVLVMPNPPLYPMLRAAGWTEATGLPRHLRYVGGVSRPILRRVLAGAMSAWGRLHGATAKADFRLEARAVLPPEYPEFWRKVAGASVLVASRDADYLTWRYLRHPLHRYTLLVLTERAELRGYAMTRTAGGEIWVDDWIVDDERAGVALGALLIEWAGRQGGATLQTRSAPTTAPTIPWGRLGFLPRPDSQPVFIAGAWQSEAGERFAAARLTPGDKDV